MAKRMTDSELWNKDWFLNLNLKQKLLVKYIFDNCDCAGVYEISYRQLKNIFDTEITKEDFLKIKQVVFISENKIFIEDFIPFQYGIEISDLNEKYSVHKGIIKKLNKINYFETLRQPLANPSLEGLQDKDKVKDKDKDKDKQEGVQGGDETEEAEETVPQAEADEDPISPDVFLVNNSAYFRTYKELCPNLLPLTFERKNKEFLAQLLRFRQEIDDDVGKFKELCKKANTLRVIADNKLDFKMVLNNYVGILNGKYNKNSSSGEEMSPDNFFKGVAINDQG